MYAYIKGKITETGESTVTIEAGGIGYEAIVSACTAKKLSVGSDAVLYTYLSVREDGISLFGFSSVAEKSLFMRLIGVSGIGPKGAVAILGGMSTDELCACIASGNASALSCIKGVGKKTAERIVMELKDKVSAEGTATESETKPLEGVAAEAVEVLVALGYKRDAAEKTVNAAYKDGMNVNQTVHKAIGGK